MNEPIAQSARSAQPILVTGSHRSGSTWVGRMLELAPHVAYIHEPFNIEQQRGSFGGQFTHFFEYVCAENEAPCVEHFERSIRLEYMQPRWLDRLRNTGLRQRARREAAYFARHRQAGSRALFKDPIALFSADWMATRFDMRVVVLIRHPAAFANSVRKAGWYHDFRHFLRQPLLMRDHLAPFAEELEEFVATDIQADGTHARSMMENAALLWKLVHHRIATYQRDFPHWHFVRHEDLSREPLERFASMYDYLGLPFTDTVQAGIRLHTDEKNPASSDRLFALKRNSREVVNVWKTELAQAEVAALRRLVGDASAPFYGPDEW